MPKTSDMYVIKRNGKKEQIYYDKITARNMKLASDLEVDSIHLSQNVIKDIVPGMTTHEIDMLSCRTAIAQSVYEPDYEILAKRIYVNDLHKNTPNSFLEVAIKLNQNKNIKGEPMPLITDIILDFIKENIVEIEAAIDSSKDYNFNYVAMSTLNKGYLQTFENKTIERPQYTWMRVALGIHGPVDNKQNGVKKPGNIKKVIQTYNKNSTFSLIHATPTIFNACKRNANLSSCFLCSCSDSIEGWADSWRNCSYISKSAGGIGIDLTPVRENGAFIGGTGGRSGGIVPLATAFNVIARIVNQEGKRKGSFSISLQPWHPDLYDFLDIKKNTGDESCRARGLFPALYIPDLLFKRLKIKDSIWSFFSPALYPELITLYGQEWEDRYIQLEKENKFVRQKPMAEVWNHILDTLMETGNPYMLAKDNINNKSAQKNIGCVTSSNLCCEITEAHKENEIASCNLASLGLPYFVQKNSEDKYYFNFEELGEITEIACENLNNVIDRNHVPAESAIANNNDYRPIGLGVQGLSQVFSLLRMIWENEETVKFQQLIFEYMYFYSLKKSVELSKVDGKYKDFETSPYAEGILQYDMWNKVPLTMSDPDFCSKYGCKSLDWNGLKSDIKEFGLRNSLFIALMPTGNTSQILGYTESFLPVTSNSFVKKLLSGSHPVVNNHLYNDLKELGLWNKKFVDDLLTNDGSVQNLKYIPQDIRNLYKTNWEIPQKWIVKMAEARGPFVDQSMSMNIFMAHPTVASLSSLYMDAWEKGLKTLSYYLRTKVGRDQVKFSIDPEVKNIKKEEDRALTPPLEVNTLLSPIVCSPTGPHVFSFTNKTPIIQDTKSPIYDTSKIEEEEDEFPVCISCT
jgi:ribonucleoside-diphosphate reductase alpha chain